MRNYLASRGYNSFAPGEVNMLVKALEEAWEAVQASPIMYPSSDDDRQTREALARYIVDAALEGECDHRSLKAAGLLRLANSPRAIAAARGSAVEAVRGAIS